MVKFLIIILAIIFYIFLELSPWLVMRDTKARLFKAVKTGDTKEVDLLLMKGASVRWTTPKGETALIIAAREGQKELVQLLMENGAFINDQDKEGKTALKIANEKGYTEIAQLLRQAGAKE